MQNIVYTPTCASIIQIRRARKGQQMLTQALLVSIFFCSYGFSNTKIISIFRESLQKILCLQNLISYQNSRSLVIWGVCVYVRVYVIWMYHFVLLITIHFKWLLVYTHYAYIHSKCICITYFNAFPFSNTSITTSTTAEIIILIIIAIIMIITFLFRWS